MTRVRPTTLDAWPADLQQSQRLRNSNPIMKSTAASRKAVRLCALTALLCVLLLLFTNFSPTKGAAVLLVRDQLWRQIIANVLNTAIFLAVAPVVARLATGTPSEAMAFRSGPLFRGFTLGAVTCGTGFVVLLLAGARSAPISTANVTDKLAELLAATSFGLVTGIVEEITLRVGLQYVLLKILRGVPLVICAQACVFVVLHLSNIAGWHGVAYYAAFGGLMSLWSFQFRSVWPAVGGHFAINFVNGMLLGDVGRAVPVRVVVDKVSLQAMTAAFFLACGLVTVIYGMRRRAEMARPSRDQN